MFRTNRFGNEYIRYWLSGSAEVPFVVGIEKGRLRGQSLPFAIFEEVNKMTLVRWTPYKELLDMPHEMTSLLGRPFRSLMSEPFFGLDTLRTPIDIYSRGDDMHVRLELPGIKAEDVDITLAEHTLTITGERHEEKEVEEGDYYRHERSFGSFERTLPVPEKVGEKDISATFEDGVLEVVIKGAVATVPARHIEVKTARGKGRSIKPGKG